MTEEEIALVRLRQEGSIEREKIKADVKKVVYGTFLVGIAVALFPVVSGFIEHHYNLRIEDAKQVNALALQANQLALDLKSLSGKASWPQKRQA